MTRIEDLVKQMTLEEKASLCTGDSPWTTRPLAHLGIPGMMLADGPHGVRRAADVNDLVEVALPATCFPTASCLASTWNTSLIHTMGEAIAEECIALKVDTVLGPGVNIKRTPLGGRNFEYYSEDPYLSGAMATSFIDGVQSKGVGTSLKHFAANNQEYRRSTINAVIDERTLREIYLPAFEMAVKNGKPWTVMCSYNRLNGTFCSENHRLLVEILKDEWGFEGFVVSDWGAVHDRVRSLSGGVDLEMPGPRELRVKAVIEAVRSGTLDEAKLDEAVRRILTIVLKAAETPKGGTFDENKHHALARRIAAEGMVLLKNDGVLPLKGCNRIAVIGRGAKDAHYQGTGSSHINPTQVDIPFNELLKLAGETRLTYTDGYPESDVYDQSMVDEAVEHARSADAALLFIALPKSKEMEGYDRPDLNLTRQQVALIKSVCAVQPDTVVILNNGSPVAMAEWIGGAAAVLEAWMMGQAGGGAIADLLFGKVNPSGKLAETFPVRLEDTPAFINYPGGNDEVHYGEGIYVGYRYYDARKVQAEFPFGYGLSYTHFSYSNLKVSDGSFNDVDGIELSVDVTNTGKVAGKEVVQLYVHDHKSGLNRPPKELKGFAKVELQPGETRTVTIRLDFRSFAYYHPGYKQWITEDGEFDLLVGASSQDIRSEQTVSLHSTLRLPSLLNRQSTLRDWLEDPSGKRIIDPLYQQLYTAIQAIFSGTSAEGIGSNPIDFLIDTPLPVLLHFMEGALPASPEAMVDGWLAELPRDELQGEK